MNAQSGLLAAICITFCSNPGYGQDYLMTTPSINACSGILYDSGGAANTYGHNEDLSTTICPSIPGTRTRLTFNTFNLSTSFPLPIDVLSIHDGASTAAPLLGSYTGTALQGLVIVASEFNASGCLTLRFRSNSNGLGNFAATILCTEPCLVSSAQFSIGSPTSQLCPGASILLDASSTSPGPPGIMQYTWLIDGQASVLTTEPVTAVTIAEPGLRAISLQVTDTAGCTTFPSEVQYVPVGGGALFTGTSAESPSCGPDTTALIGYAQVPWLVSALPVVDYGTGMHLADDVGFQVLSHLLVDWFAPGDVLTDQSMLGDVCINLEHSFMGDLFIRLRCPNGQSAVIHAQGGGATFLGQPNQNDTILPMPYGECWNYCFSPQAALGTLAACSYVGATPNVAPFENYWTLLPGTYTPAQPLSNLVGCPLNGTWRLEVIDNWGADNGYLCGWSLGLTTGPDSLFSGGPSINLTHPDSAYWDGPGLLPTSYAAQAQALPPSLGMHAYTFTVIDSYGCPADTALAVEALPPAATPIITVVGSSLNSTWAMAYQWYLNGEPIAGAIDQIHWPTVNGDYQVLIVDANGCTALSSVQYFGSASIVESAGALIRAYPQPVRGEVIVDGLVSSTSASLVDVSGRMVWNGSLTAPRSTLAMGHLSPGFYSLRIADAQGYLIGIVKE